MMLNNILNIRRLSRLMINELRIHTKGVLLVIAIITMTLIHAHPLHPNDLTRYFFILYSGGAIATVFAFKDIHDRSKAHLLLMLPCSNLERFLSKWLLTSVIFALIILAIYSVCSLLANIISYFLFARPIVIFDITQSSLWIGIGKYLILQTVILLGAITFKKRALIKTLLVFGSILFVFSVFTLSIAWSWFYPEYIVRSFVSFFSQTFIFIYYVLWILLAPFCLYLIYLKLTELELK